MGLLKKSLCKIFTAVGEPNSPRQRLPVAKHLQRFQFLHIDMQQGIKKLRRGVGVGGGCNDNEILAAAIDNHLFMIILYCPEEGVAPLASAIDMLLARPVPCHDVLYHLFPLYVIVPANPIMFSPRHVRVTSGHDTDLIRTKSCTGCCGSSICTWISTEFFFGRWGGGGGGDGTRWSMELELKDDEIFKKQLIKLKKYVD